MFPQSRAARIEVGYGLEGALPDVVASRILRNEAIPRFSRGDFDGGVRAAVEAAMEATRGEYKGTGRRLSGRTGRGIPGWVVPLLLFFVLPLVFSGLGLGGGRRRYWYIGGGGWGGGGFGGGWGGGGGGGGFSGGGGSFGGGGASGSW